MIAVTAIVKNEEQLLEKMLKSCKDLPVFILDTGSSDGSYDLYYKYNVTWKKYSQWDDCKGTSDRFSFSEARNEALEMANDYEWRVILDADEYLKGDFVRDLKYLVAHKKDRQTKKTVDLDKFDIISVEVETNSEVLDSPRVLRNIPEIYYEDIVHNRIKYSEENKDKAYGSGLKIRSGYSPNHDVDPDRTIKLLERSIREDPIKARFYYYLAREYMTRFGKQKILHVVGLLEHYCYLAQATNEKADAHLLLGVSYLEMRNNHMARFHAWEALKIVPTLQPAWQLVYQLGVDKFKPFYQKVIDIADNDGALTVRKDGQTEGKD